METARKRITLDLIKRHFGRDVTVTKFGGRFRVVTDTGGEVLIYQNRMQVLVGGDDIYRGTTLLAHEVWGGAVAHGGREHLLAAVAHGEAWGVKVRADHTNAAGFFVRVLVAVCVVSCGVKLLKWGEFPAGYGALSIAAAVIVVWMLMQRSEKRAERSRAEAMGFNYPRVNGSKRDGSRDDAEREGWL